MRHLICLALAIAGLPAADLIVPTGTLSGTQTFGPAQTVSSSPSGTTAVASTANITLVGRTTNLRSGFSVVLGGALHIRTGPGFTIPPTITPSPVTTSTATASALGWDSDGEGALTYTWAAVGSSPTTVSFSPNGTNGAKSSTATFTLPGSYTIQCTATNPATGLSAIATVVVAKNAPPVITAVTANPNPLTAGKTSVLTVTATDDGGAANLTTTWSMISGPSGAVPVFAPNGSIGAHQSSITVDRVGTYTLRASVTDAGNLTTTGTVVLTVTGAATAILIDPPVAQMEPGKTAYFTAKIADQFGQAMTTTNFSWSCSGVTLAEQVPDSTVLLTAGTAQGDSLLKVQATGYGSLTGTAKVTIKANDPGATPLVVSKMDQVAWTNNTNGYRATYLAGQEAGRIWDVQYPGSAVVPLVVTSTSNGGSRRLSTTSGGSVSLSVTGPANAPVTFYCPGEGKFSTNANVITVQANTSGVAVVTFWPFARGVTPVLVASPLASGQVRFSVEVP